MKKSEQQRAASQSPRQRTPQFNLIVPDSAFLDEIEEWRARQRPVMSRSAAIIELCRRALEVENPIAQKLSETAKK